MAGIGGRVGRVGRPRVVDRLVAARRVALVAPSGYGKSVTTDELAARLGWAAVLVDVSARAGADPLILAASVRRSLRAAGLRALAEAMTELQLLPDLLAARDDPVLLVFDEVQHLRGDAATGLGALVSALPEPHHVAVTGQRSPGWAEPPPFDLEVGARDLAFEPDEVIQLAAQMRRPVSASEAEAIISATAGWPAAVVLALEAGVLDARGVGAGIASLVERLLAGADAETRASTVSLAWLPVLSEAVATAVAGPRALARVAATGIPLRERADGWLVLPDPVRDVLVRLAGDEVGRDTAIAAGNAYFDAGAGHTAINFLLERRDHEALAQTLEKRTWLELQEFDPVELRSVVSIMPARILEAHPRLLFVLARAANAAGELRWRGELLERAASSAALADDAPLARHIDAERANVAALNGDVNGAAGLALSVLVGAGPDEAAARAQALASLGRARAFERDPAAIREATERLTEGATLARLAGEKELLATTLTVLGYNVHYAEGDLTAARARLREAADAAPIGGRFRAGIQTFLADVLAYAGALDEAEAVLREVADVGHRLRDQGVLGYHAWAKAAIASRRGDAVALATWLAEGERHPGDWFAHPTGIEFLAEGVDWLGRVGDHATAARYLARVEQRCASDPHEGVDQIALYARGVHGARAGDPVAAEADLAAFLETEQMPRREAWRVHMLRGLAALRAGSDEAAAAHAARAFEEAAAIGHPELPQIHEPLAVELLLPVARRTRSAAVVRATESEAGFAIRLLGAFALTAAGRPVDPPPGRPTTMVKLLAVTARAIALDEAVETLWPEVDPATGRARMRNVLARIRSSCGELVRRDGTALALAADVVVDSFEFERDGRAALRASGDEMLALAQRAVARYAGELLPADRYEDFTVSARERLALLNLTLLDRLAGEAARAGDVDEALRRYGEAIAAAPLDEHRYELAAALAMRHGRRQRARELVDQARRVLNDLGVEPSASILAIGRDLEAGATR